MPNSTASRRVRSLGATAGKLGFAALVFTTVMVGWSYGGHAVRMRMPLPGLLGKPAERCTLWFVGSSTVSRWTKLSADMAPWKVRRRGVSGATLAEIRQRFGRDGAVPPPAGIVLYAGENDIAAGRTPEETVADMAGILAAAAERYPGVPRYVVALKPSPARWPQRAAQLRYDALVRSALAQERPSGRFIADGEQLMRAGAPDPRFYVADGVHLNDIGYALWGGTLRRRVEAAMPAGLRRQCLGKVTNS